MATMSFGKRERIRFHAAGPLNSWTPQGGPAVFAITYKQDAKARPKSHTVLFFGESEDLAAQAAAISKNINKWWSDHGGDAGNLYLFIHDMPDSSTSNRYNLKHQLVLEYDPQAN